MVLTRLTNTRLTLKCSLNFFTKSYKKTQSKQQTYCRAIRKRCWWCFVIIIKERKQITSLKMQLLSICEHIVQVSKQVSALIYLILFVWQISRELFPDCRRFYFHQVFAEQIPKAVYQFALQFICVQILSYLLFDPCNFKNYYVGK